MSKSDEETIMKVLLILVGLAVFGFVLWLIGSTIQFLSEHLFVYGLITGLVVGSFITYAVPKWVIPWWNNSFIPWIRNIF